MLAAIEVAVPGKVIETRLTRMGLPPYSPSMLKRLKICSCRAGANRQPFSSGSENALGDVKARSIPAGNIELLSAGPQRALM